MQRLLRGAAAAGRRSFTVSSAARVDDTAAAAATKAFLEKFAARAPSTMAPPHFPTDFCAPTSRLSWDSCPAFQRS